MWGWSLYTLSQAVHECVHHCRVGPKAGATEDSTQGEKTWEALMSGFPGRARCPHPEGLQGGPEGGVGCLWESPGSPVTWNCPDEWWFTRGGSETALFDLRPESWVAIPPLSPPGGLPWPASLQRNVAWLQAQWAGSRVEVGGRDMLQGYFPGGQKAHHKLWLRCQSSKPRLINRRLWGIFRTFLEPLWAFLWLRQ